MIKFSSLSPYLPCPPYPPGLISTPQFKLVGLLMRFCTVVVLALPALMIALSLVPFCYLMLRAII